MKMTTIQLGEGVWGGGGGKGGENYKGHARFKSYLSIYREGKKVSAGV